MTATGLFAYDWDRNPGQIVEWACGHRVVRHGHAVPEACGVCGETAGRQLFAAQLCDVCRHVLLYPIGQPRDQRPCGGDGVHIPEPVDRMPL